MKLEIGNWKGKTKLLLLLLTKVMDVARGEKYPIIPPKIPTMTPPTPTTVRPPRAEEAAKNLQSDPSQFFTN